MKRNNGLILKENTIQAFPQMTGLAIFVPTNQEPDATCVISSTLALIVFKSVSC